MKIFYFLILLLCFSIEPIFAQEVFTAHTGLKLLSEQDAVVPGETFWVGFDFKLEDGWHVYWQNAGDSGLPPKIKWDLPSGVKAGTIQWPYPERINLGPLTSFGYEHELVLLVPMTVAGDLSKTGNLNLHANVGWLICKDMCVPGRADLDLSLPWASDMKAVNFTSSKNLFEQIRKDIPKTIPSISAKVSLEGHQWLMDIQTPHKRQADVLFYPFRDDMIEHPAGQHTQLTDNGYRLSLAQSHLYQGFSMGLDGVAVNPEGWDDEGRVKAMVIHAPIVQPSVHLAFWAACLSAFIGGLVLNLMPCVLPVLSIKVLHLLKRHPDRKTALVHSMFYAGGILVSVWSLALMLFILKSGGQFAGWGFQFQSPVFVIIVAVVLLVLALNLFGVFEFTLPSIGGLKAVQPGYQASFISGVITMVVASPCTAPFMGTALTVAISQPGTIGFGIFTFLGLGLALPFIVLSVFPSLLILLPKPGAWMIRLKQVLGLVLLACVLWLLWVFCLQTGIGAYPKSANPSDGIQWQSYSSSAVNQARLSGHGVFIDFTAAWCINCQVNDRLVLQSRDVVRAFKENGIMAFKGDWTKYDPAITQALAMYGRDSIPVYVYYPPRADSPIILNQLITPKGILRQVGGAKYQSK